MFYAVALPLEESATEMLSQWQSSPKPGDWDAVLGPAALKFSLPRAAPPAQPRCAKASVAWGASGTPETTDLPVLEWPSTKC